MQALENSLGWNAMLTRNEQSVCCLKSNVQLDIPFPVKDIFLRQTRPMKVYKVVLSILIGLTTFSACKKEEIDIRQINYGLQPEFGVPIARATLSAQRVIDNFDSEGLIQTGENGLLTLVYRDTFETITAGDVLKLPNQTFDTSIDLSSLQSANLLGQGSVTISENEIFSLISDEGDKLDSIRFESGIFRLVVQSEGNFPISGKLELRSADNATVFFAIEFQDNTAPVYIENIKSFENVLIELLNDGDTENGIRVAYEFTFNNEGNFNTQSVDISFELTDFSIRSAGGYIVPRTIPVENEGIDISMFNDVPNVEVRLEDPRLNFFIANGFGLGLKLEVDEIFGTNRLGESIRIDGEDIAALNPVSGANSPGEIAHSEITINNETITPSVTDILAFMPNYLTGDFGVTVNPDNAPSVFVSNADGLDITFEAEIPLYGSLANFLLIDTTDIQLADVVEEAENVGEISALDIRLFVKNGLPLDAGVQILFTDSLYRLVDSLFTEPTFVFLSAPVNLAVSPDHPDYGRTTGSTETVIDISIPRDRIDPLKDVSRIIIHVFGHTTGNGDHPVRIFSEDDFEINLAAKVTLDIND